MSLQKSKRGKKKWIICSCLLLAVLVAGTSVYLLRDRLFGNAQASDSLELLEGQTELNGKILDLSGNEVELALGSMQEVALQGMMGASNAPATLGTSAETRKHRIQRNGPGHRQALRRARRERDGLDGAALRGMPEGEMPEGEMPTGGASRAMRRPTALFHKFVENGETASYTIPVSAKVSKGSGENKTTANFTMLSTEMTIRVIRQGELIVAIEVVE
jgi:hypothetical protein